MRQLHVECDPDEALGRALGFSRKQIRHHQGKSRVFASLAKTKGNIGIVDEDPESPTTTYEKKLKRVAEKHGITQYEDSNGNKVLVLKGKLEDWIISLANSQNFDLKKHSLPDIPNKLHTVINQRIPKFEELLKDLFSKKNPGILQLKEFSKG